MKPEHFRDARKFFTVGLMREPCQYMLSEYTWGATGWGTGQPRDAAHTHPMGHLALDLHARGQGALYAPPHSKERFATWLRSRYVTAADAVAADGAPRCGLLSMRLYTQAAKLSAAAAVNPRGCGTHRASIVGRNGCPCPLARCAGAASAPVHAACHKALNSAPLPPFDCWLHTETLDTDFAACMRKYHRARRSVGAVAGHSSDATAREAHPRPLAPARAGARARCSAPAGGGRRARRSVSSRSVSGVGDPPCVKRSPRCRAKFDGRGASSTPP